MSSTLEKMLQQYVENMAARISPNTIRTIRHRVNCWQQFRSSVSKSDFESFRNSMLQLGRSPRTIESVIDTIRMLYSHDGIVIDTGRKLKTPRPRPTPPSIDQVDNLYRFVSVAKWPHRLTLSRRCDWWRAYLVVSCWAGYSTCDLIALRWCDIKSSTIEIVRQKNARFGYRHIVPVTKMVRRHLSTLTAIDSVKVFGAPRQTKQLRRELKRICEAANVAGVVPKELRQFCITQWARVDGMAAKLIQGSALGVMDHYVDVERVLFRAATSVEMPLAFYTASERDEVKRRETDLITSFRRTTKDKQDLLIRVANEIA